MSLQNRISKLEQRRPDGADIPQYIVIVGDGDDSAPHHFRTLDDVCHDWLPVKVYMSLAASPDIWDI